MKKRLCLLLFLALAAACCAIFAAAAETDAPEGLFGEWFVETCRFPESEPDAVFAGTNYSSVLEFTDDGLMRMTDPFNGTSVWTWEQDGSTITVDVYLEEGETRDPAAAESVKTLSVADGKLVMQGKTAEGGETCELVFSREPVSGVIPGKKFPESLADFAGTWRISGYGKYGFLIAAEDLGLEGTAEITDNVLVMKWTRDGAETEETFEFEPQLMYDSLFRAENGGNRSVTLREDGTLLFITGHAVVLWTFAPME